MKRLGKIRYKFGTGIAVGGICRIAILFWVYECIEVAGEEVALKLLFHLGGSREVKWRFREWGRIRM